MHKIQENRILKHKIQKKKHLFSSQKLLKIKQKQNKRCRNNINCFAYRCLCCASEYFDKNCQDQFVQKEILAKSSN
jgi:hypothetical protein